MLTIPTLITPRLLLRPFALADAPRAQQFAGDARVAKMTAIIPHPYPDGAAEKWIASLALTASEEKEFTFAVTFASDLIGAVGIGHDEDPSTAVLGYWIGVPWWNQGFATEAGHAILEFAFNRRGYLRVNSNHFAQNPASGRVMQKLGMTRQETQRRHFPVRGESYDVVYYSITRPEWLPRPNAVNL